MGMFGTSGVRGVVGERITTDLALRIGAAVGEDTETLTVGRDTRTTGKGLENAVVAGALSAGADVERVGVAPTPTIVRYADDTSLVVTASHNPPEYNGFKPWNADGTAFDAEQRAAVERRVKEGQKSVRASEFGDDRTVDDALRRHADSVVDAVADADVRVVVDGGGGAGSRITPRVLRRLGCDVVTVNCDYDGSFSARLPEPTDENLDDLKNAVVAFDADMGLAHDGDADRVAVVDSSGEYVEPDRLMALFALWEGADRVVAPVNTSTVVDEVAEVTRTAVGDVNVAAEIKQNGGDFGGEPSNNWIFPDETLCPDGVLAGAKVCALASERSLRERIDDLPPRYVRRGNFDVADERKPEVMDGVAERAEAEYGEFTTVDGVRVGVEGGWFLIRPSGTEPKVRVTAEGETEERADEVYDVATNILQEAMDSE
ncbi:MAG: phosphoglucosamine mutase [Halobacteriales archaeon]|nr:phosphoglucosamine mutase [Halobacteriales archaeon]